MPKGASPSTRYTSVTHPDSFVTPAVQAVLDKSAAYVLPVYARPPFVLSHGKGSYVWDTEGRRYLDFCAGIAVNALGHADEEFIKVCAQHYITAISRRLAFVHNRHVCRLRLCEPEATGCVFAGHFLATVGTHSPCCFAGDV